MCLDKCEIVVARRGRVGLGLGVGGRGALDDGDRNSISGGLVVREKRKRSGREKNYCPIEKKVSKLKTFFPDEVTA